MVGQLLYQSHESLRDDFEVSCAELDSIVEILSQTAVVSGARLTGAGFGGAVVGLVQTDAVPTVANAVDKTSVQVLPIKIDNGARLLEMSR